MKQYTIVILIFCAGFIHAQDTLSLEKAIQIGLENNYQMQIAGKQLEIDRNNNAWGTAGAYPSLSFSTVLNDIVAFDSGGEIMKEESLISITPSVNLNWVVFNGFSVWISKSRLAYFEQLSEGNTVIVVENTIQSILLAYHLVQLQSEALEVFNTVKDLSYDRYAYENSRKELGNAVTFDVLQAQNNYLADSANALLQEINFRNALRNLNLILAEPVEKDFVIVEEMMEVDQEFMLADLISKLESSNKTLQNQYINQEILRKNIDQSKTKLYPVVSLSAGLNRGINRFYDGGINGFYSGHDTYRWDNGNYAGNASLSLSYTLSNGGNVRRAIQNSRMQEEMGTLQIDQMKQSLYNQLFRILEEYSIRRQLLHVSEARLEAAELNLSIGTDKFKSGAINSFNYRDIQLLYQNAALEKLQSRYNLIDSYSELLRLTGGIITEFE